MKQITVNNIEVIFTFQIKFLLWLRAMAEWGREVPCNVNLAVHEGHKSGVRATLQELYLWGKSLRPSLDRRLDDFHSKSSHYSEKKHPYPWRESTPDRPGRSLGSTGLYFLLLPVSCSARYWSAFVSSFSPLSAHDRKTCSTISSVWLSAALPSHPLMIVRDVTPWCQVDRCQRFG
jgi:hypothetical protein